MFKQWCTQQGFANSSNLSHTLMDGGVLSVPFDRLDEFYQKYIEAILIGEQLFVIERNTQVFNFFVDLDYKSFHPLSMDRIEHLSRKICDRVGKNCLISVAKPKKIGNKIKTGVHLNWSEYPVNQTSAVALRSHIINLLSIDEPNEDWDAIVDKSVYGNPEKGTKGSGFRMPWSYKKGKHTECDGKGCSGCSNTGKITEGCYLPVFKYTHGNPFSILSRISPQPSVELLKASTIRTNETTFIEVEPPPPPTTTKKKPEGKFTKAQTKNEVEDQEIYNRLETFIRLHLEGQGSMRINKIFKQDTAYLIGTNSGYCENIERSHNSNHVWFVANETCVYQRCFCTCETLKGRKNGFCKDFSGKKHMLPPTIANLLFPNKKTDKIKAAIRPNVSIVRDTVHNSCRILLPTA